jgi:hypothetical protein
MNNMILNGSNYVDLEKTLGPAAIQNIFGKKLVLNNDNKNDCAPQQNGTFKTIHLYYNGEYIQDVKIDKSESFNELQDKFKSILFQNGKVSYRPALREETIVRENPSQTLEFLINRGIKDNSPSLSFCNKNTLKNYPPTCYNYNQINNGDKLQAKYEDKIFGGGIGGINFVNVDELTKGKDLKDSLHGKEWRKIDIGLNLFGNCNNKKCQAHNKEVIYIVGINKKFDVCKDIKKIICPVCSKNILPKTMGFWKCEYQIKGEKYKDGSYEDVDINGKETREKNFEYFDSCEKGTSFWSKLEIFTGHRQEMKYEKNSI